MSKSYGRMKAVPKPPAGGKPKGDGGAALKMARAEVKRRFPTFGKDKPKP